METNARPRRIALARSLRGLRLGCLVAVLIAHLPTTGVSAAPEAGIVVIHDAAETLRDHCRWEDGALWFHLPSGSRFELVTSTADPAISNPGDGAFHPFDATEVRAALDGVRYPRAAISCDIWVLPYPRRGALESAAGPGFVLLSPAVLPIPRERQHSEVVHELGHIVHHAWMPDADFEAWTRYRGLRGIADAEAFSAEAAHANRPHEIFAEDFRALFGGPLATATGTIENPDLAAPAAVPGLESFMRSLAGLPTAGASFAVWPNPSTGPVRIAYAGASGAAVLPGDLLVFDAAGRRVARLAPATSTEATWVWDGRNASGAPVAPGTYLARGGWGTVRIVRVR